MSAKRWLSRDEGNLGVASMKKSKQRNAPAHIRVLFTLPICWFGSHTILCSQRSLCNWKCNALLKVLLYCFPLGLSGCIACVNERSIFCSYCVFALLRFQWCVYLATTLLKYILLYDLRRICQATGRFCYGFETTLLWSWGGFGKRRFGPNMCLFVQILTRVGLPCHHYSHYISIQQNLTPTHLLYSFRN